MNASNRRNMPRFKQRIQMTLKGLTTAYTVDVSAGGVSAEVARAVASGTTVVGELEVSGKKFPFTGVVQWARRPDLRLLQRGKIGIRITGIVEEFYRQLQFVAERAGAKRVA